MFESLQWRRSRATTSLLGAVRSRRSPATIHNGDPFALGPRKGLLTRFPRQIFSINRLDEPARAGASSRNARSCLPLHPT
jgi:hypothetical protein